MISRSRGLLTTCALVLAAGAATAQEITLRTADSLPVGHYMAEGVLKPLTEMTTEKTGGKVVFEHFPAQQLGKAKDLFSLAQSGVTDIAYVGASYTSDKLPLSSVGELPEAFNTSCEGTMAFWEIAKPGGVLDQAEYAPQGMRALAALVLPPYQIFSASEITSLDDLKGQKVRATGAAKQIALTKLGAVPVSMPAPETREALSRGTVDAIAFPHSSILPYDLVPHLKTATEGTNFGAFVALWMISQDKFDSLPEDVQTALTEAGEAATRNGCEVTDAVTEKDKQAIAEGGVSFVTLPEADMIKLAETMASVGDEWAAELDGRDAPGTKILKAFREALNSGS